MQITIGSFKHETEIQCMTQSYAYSNWSVLAWYWIINASPRVMQMPIG